MMRRALTIFCFVLAAVVGRGVDRCSAADPSPDDVLKNNGLTKQGVVYVIDSDATIGVALRSWKATQAKYAEANSRRTNLENSVRAAKATIDRLAQQNDVETNKLDHINKNAMGTYNRQVGVVNDIRSNIRDGLKVVEQRQKLLDGLVDPTDEYTAAIQKLAQRMELTVQQYDTLAADPAVKGAIVEINKTAKPQVKLGPSDVFATELPKIRNLQKLIVSSTINFEMLGGTPHVLVTLNGTTKAAMAIDSGAAVVMLSSETGEKLNIHPGPEARVEKFSIADGSIVEAPVVTLSSVQLGAFTVENVEAAVLPASVKGADNLLGGTFLKHFVYKMDLAGSSIHLTQIPTAGATAAAPATTQRATAKSNAKSKIDTLIVQAFVDGNTELHITPDGIYWEVHGVNRVGEHSDKDYATYVNGDAWNPEWMKRPKGSNTYRSEPLPVDIGTADFEYEVVAVAKSREATGVEKRDPVTSRAVGNEQVLSIPDTQGGARWYTLRLSRR